MTTKELKWKCRAAIKYLKNNPEEIEKLWEFPHEEHGILFDYIGPDFSSCLTQIKRGKDSEYLNYSAPTSGNKLIDDIIKVSNIPDSPEKIKPKHLKTFAKLQVLIHKLLKKGIADEQ